MSLNTINLGPPAAIAGVGSGNVGTQGRHNRGDAGSEAKQFESVLKEKAKGNTNTNSNANSPKSTNSDKASESSRDMTSRTQRSETGSGEDKGSIEDRAIEKPGDGKTKVKVSERQKAMLKFMDSIESEFGIPPMRIVEAMAKLDESTLSLPPEMTAEAIIEDLDLSPENSLMAQAMYLQMLSQTSAKPVAMGVADKQSNSSAEVLALPATLAAVKQLAAKQEKAQLHSSLGRMQDMFFMKNQIPMDGASLSENQWGALREQPMFSAESLLEMAPVEFDSSMATGGSIEIPENMAMQNSLELAEGLEMTPHQLRQLAQEVGSPQAYRPAAAQPQWSQLNKPGQEVQLSQLESAWSTESSAGAGEALLAAPPVMKEFASFSDQGGNSFSSSQEFEGFDSLGSMGEEQSFFVEPNGGLSTGSLAQDNAKIATGVSAAFAETSQSPNLSTSDRAANIQKIMDQAQVMIRNGGGEMTVKMSPEGLGQVQLKVNVENGKVDIKMATNSLEAKSMLESTVSDLKERLSANSLTVGSVKVDVATQNSERDHSQNQSFGEQNSDLGREQARQFLGQFQQFNSARRQGFFDAPGFKAYTPQNREDVNPAPVASASRYRSVDKGNGLNLVA